MDHDAGVRGRRDPHPPSRAVGYSLAVPRVPDFCNLGTWLRVMIGANALALMGALARNRELARLPGEFVELAALVEPIVLCSLLVPCVGRSWLARVGEKRAALVVLALAMALGAALALLLAPIAGTEGASAWRVAMWSGLGAVVLLTWFDLAARVHAPALAEARLMALTARIRPHFLFNSLNAVLGVIRSDPRRAETAIEELAELFRVLMKDNRELVPLSDEIALARQYLDLERLRLGERLQVRWDVESCPPDALVPPLMLQPLLENAVYHGIEPLSGPGEIRVLLARRRDRLLIEIANPRDTAGAGGHHTGSQMALANIRERLLLFFDIEASLAIEANAGQHRVRIEFPYRQPATK